MATALHSTRTRFFDKCGKPLCGGSVYTYQVGTTTAKPTYTDASKTAMNTNPVILDSIGSAAIFLDGAYRVRVIDRNGVLVEDIAYIESWISATEKDKIYEAIDGIDEVLTAHSQNYNNPHQVTKNQIGLGDVDNTADIDKPVSAPAKTYIDQQDALKADSATTYSKSEVDTKVSAVSGGYIGAFATLSELNAKTGMTVGQVAKVMNDTTATNNGDYRYTGSAWVKGYDALTDAKTYADAQDATVKQTTKADINNQLNNANGLKNFIGVGTLPIVTDANNAILLGYDANKQEFVGNILDKTNMGIALNNGGLYNYIGGGIVPLVTDANNKIILGYNADTSKIVGNFDVSAEVSNSNIVNYGQYITALNHVMSYGQSLSTGSNAVPLLSLTQPYNNVKFVGGIRGNNEFTSTVPLTEDERRDQGTASNGETPVSGAANYAVMSAYRDAGILPSNHVLLGSASGIGGKRLEFLVKGTEQYNQYFLAHINGGAALSTDYSYQATLWLQGESDVDTDYQTYKSMFYQMISDIATDTLQISKQKFKPAFLTYQTSTSNAAGKISTPALAQLDAVKDGKAFFAAPTYRFAAVSDGIHLTNEASKLMGCYFGRAYKQLVIDKRKPDYLEPLSATIIDNVITVRFKVPTLPLVLDKNANGASRLEPTYGFIVNDNTGVSQAITSVVVNGSNVVITLTNTPTTPLTVRYACDNRWGARVWGNLRDSTADSVVINGNTYQMYHVAPHFILPIVNLGV